MKTVISEEQYNRAVKLLDKLIDRVSEEPNEIIDARIHRLGMLIEAYEDKYIPESMSISLPSEVGADSNWREFIRATSGSLADAPITRGEQGRFEVRDELE